MRRLFKLLLTFVKKHYGSIASRGIVSRLVVSVTLGSEAARPGAAELPRCERQKLRVEPTTKQTYRLPIFTHTITTCGEMRTA